MLYNSTRKDAVYKISQTFDLESDESKLHEDNNIDIKRNKNLNLFIIFKAYHIKFNK